MISGRRKCKEIERKSIGAKSKRKQSENRAKTGQEQGYARLRSLRESSTKLALRCETISQLNWLICENFCSYETDFGTRVPLRSTGAPISQLRIGYEATKHKNSQFRSQSSIPQGFSQLRNRFWHTSATSQHRSPHFEAAKWSAKIVFFCETLFLLRNSKWPLIFRYFL